LLPEPSAIESRSAFHGWHFKTVTEIGTPKSPLIWRSSSDASAPRCTSNLANPEPTWSRLVDRAFSTLIATSWFGALGEYATIRVEPGGANENMQPSAAPLRPTGKSDPRPGRMAMETASSRTTPALHPAKPAFWTKAAFAEIKGSILLSRTLAHRS